MDWDIFTKFGILRDPDLRTRAQPNRNRKLIRDVNGRHLENFNDALCTIQWSKSSKIGCGDTKWDTDGEWESKSKPVVEFKYGSRSLYHTGSSYNSAVEWDSFTKFGTVTDPDLLRTTALSNWNRTLIRDVNGRHLDNFNNVITAQPMVRFTWRLAELIESSCKCHWIVEATAKPLFTRVGCMHAHSLIDRIFSCDDVMVVVVTTRQNHNCKPFLEIILYVILNPLSVTELSVTNVRVR